MTQDSLGVPHDIKAKRHDPSLLPSSPWLLTQPPPPPLPTPKHTHAHITYTHTHLPTHTPGKVEDKTREGGEWNLLNFTPQNTGGRVKKWSKRKRDRNEEMQKQFRYDESISAAVRSPDLTNQTAACPRGLTKAGDRREARPSRGIEMMCDRSPEAQRRATPPPPNSQSQKAWFGKRAGSDVWSEAVIV